MNFSFLCNITNVNSEIFGRIGTLKTGVLSNIFQCILIPAYQHFRFIARIIDFTYISIIRVDFKIDDYSTVNPDNYDVWFHIGCDNNKVNSNGNDDDDKGGNGKAYKCGPGKLDVHGKAITFNGSVYVPDGQIHVHNSNYKTTPVYMTGMFIAENVQSNGKYVYWNWYNCGNGSKGNNAMPQNTASIEEISNSSYMKVYPNPLTDAENITVEFSQTHEKTAYVELYNLVGERLNQIKIDNTNLHINRLSVNMTTLPVGIYMIRVVSGEEMHTQKVIKTK